jgi:tetratricopeptide (TPR) repeat protein
VDDAIEALERCLKAAKLAKELSAAGTASQRIAALYRGRGQWQEALLYYRNFLELARVNRDKASEGRACCAVAACQQQLGDAAAAIKTLETYISASVAPDLYAKAVACSNVGLLFYAQRMYDHACSYFERSYEAAKALGDRKLLNTARFNLGVARGALNMRAYVDVVNTDLGGVLDWKLRRRPFAGGQFAV